MVTQGVDPELDFSDIDGIKDVYEECTELTVHDRHPYVGDLVYTAFSGSHQDAISKGLKARARENRTIWDVPYLPMDPKDVGRDYEAIVKINSQSGKGGAAFILEHKAGYILPKPMQVEFSRFVQLEADSLKRELNQDEIISIFTREFLNRTDSITMENVNAARNFKDDDNEKVTLTAVISINGDSKEYVHSGDGALNALTGMLNKIGYNFNISTYDEHAMSEGSDAVAAAYIGITKEDGSVFFGAGTDSDISLASANALLSAVNRAF
jgi:2-isopropylmalate synthase